MIDGLAPLNKLISDALHDFREFEATLAAAIAMSQDTCPHMQVIHCDLHDMEYFSALEPLRMCTCCRVEEEGTYLADRRNWRVPGLVKPTLGNEPHRLVVEARREDLYALRLPGDRHLVKPKESAQC